MLSSPRIRAQLNTTSNKGFTLLEVLIAIAIFSIISLSSFTIFNSVLSGDEMAKKHSARQNELQRAFLIIERDFTQISRRTMRLNGEAPQTRLIQTDSEGFENEEQVIAFVRNGWTNPGLLLPRSDMQAVAYRITEETLERLHFNFVDSVVGEEPKVRPLIHDVTEINFEYYDGKDWLELWEKETLPLAIAIEIDTKDYGLIRRQYLVPGDGQLQTTSNRALGLGS
ncbi:type II secretion system minor pseudopilin GspJ [Colwellia sp. 1_MG-2023]|uniref:type II secretion system minor pseudopilin GspJ n=1 Tax=unclassified Colwellia TaxID=196834 RepID=UPI001C09A0AC|nr:MULTISPECIES: type II secretion system minor pseudopilin GspJ [unclassified Colwellia]MBU2923113.1 type II secretion system minor pseudopilin GspJ [Colwellia sp. C2M11]MDO6654198.1 type II secretion system minor pseudopilin GspJ [Colwellia sp. 3_MG-2023]MDO6667240.1 type II secretion system minor pseudopilin GspJ [Colwellia sp. 2_MG-2023]MDO6691593.1 type II secretion system minor pseudopilin GspJ [Colwellia sp. 1_MG-2023]